jgi:hypothetical protein
MTVKIPIDVDDTGTVVGDVCGPVTWPPASAGPISTTEVPAATTSTSCRRSDKVTITVTRAAPGPLNSFAPGSFIASPSIDASFKETGSENEPSDMFQIFVDVYSPPVLQIQDLDTSNSPVISSPAASPSPLMVGQELKLSASAAGGQIVTSVGASPGVVTWSPEGIENASVVASYSPGPRDSISSPEPVGLPGEDLTSNPITLYYLTDKSKKIDVSAYVQIPGPVGPPLEQTAETFYPIQTMTSHKASARATAGPTVSPYGLSDGTGFTSNCTSPPPGGITYIEGLHLGNGCIPHGIDFTYSASAPAIGAGAIYLVQLVTTTLSYASGGYSASYSSGASPVLDTKYPYFGGLTNPSVAIGGGQTADLLGALDAPVAYLSVTGVQALSGACTTVTRNDTFQDFFTYQATQGSPPPSAAPVPLRSPRASIPVTIASLTWTWGGTATTTDGQMTWSGSGLVSPDKSIESKASSDLPWWSSSSTDLVSQIPANPCPTATPSPTPSPSPAHRRALLLAPHQRKAYL